MDINAEKTITDWLKNKGVTPQQMNEESKKILHKYAGDVARILSASTVTPDDRSVMIRVEEMVALVAIAMTYGSYIPFLEAKNG